VPGVEQRPPGVRRQCLDAEWAGERHVGAVEAVGPDEVGAPIRIVVGELDGAGRLARDLDHPAPVAPAQPGSLLTPRELPQQRLWPEVLMNVNAQRL
jgi:hypothetical protein